MWGGSRAPSSSLLWPIPLPPSAFLRSDLFVSGWLEVIPQLGLGQLCPPLQNEKAQHQEEASTF